MIRKQLKLFNYFLSRKVSFLLMIIIECGYEGLVMVVCMNWMYYSSLLIFRGMHL